jgi:hypothetical protein
MLERAQGSRFVAASLLAFNLSLGAPARAEPTPTERAAAEALFQSGTELMAEGKASQACPKYEGSLELDAALGTMLRLADCYDHLGKTASAWAMFRDAASVAHTRGEAVREQMASERAADLEKRLSRLRLKVDPANGDQLTIRVGDAQIPSANHEALLPLDPGPARVEASAPGRRPFTTTVVISSGPSLQDLAIPVLRAAPAASVPATPPPGAHAETQTPGGSSSEKTFGYGAGVVGLAGLATGAFLAYRANTMNERSLAECRPEDHSACTAAGVKQRDSATSLATMATVATISGGALLAGGLVLVLLAPTSEQKASVAPRLRVAGSFDATGGSVAMQGRW